MPVAELTYSMDHRTSEVWILIEVIPIKIQLFTREVLNWKIRLKELLSNGVKNLS